MKKLDADEVGSETYRLSEYRMSDAVENMSECKKKPKGTAYTVARDRRLYAGYSKRLKKYFYHENGRCPNPAHSGSGFQLPPRECPRTDDDELLVTHQIRNSTAHELCLSARLVCDYCSSAHVARELTSFSSILELYLGLLVSYAP